MKQTINLAQFCDLFKAGGRGYQFSYYGLGALYEHLTDLEDETGEEYELDIIELCSVFAEYENLAEFAEDYGAEYATIDAISDETTVISIPGTDSFIIRPLAVKDNN